MNALKILPKKPATLTTLLFGTAVALSAFALPVLADDQVSPVMNQQAAGKITVTGQGQVSAAPDLAIVSLGVMTEGDEAADALSTNNERQAAVLEALKSAGIAEADLQTSDLRLEQRLTRPENEAPRIDGYTASNMVQARIRNLDQLGEVLDSAIKAGATNLANLEFQREDDAALRDEARTAAVKDAIARAELLADAAGVALGDIQLIAETEEAPGPRVMAMRAVAADSVPVAAGEVSITARVRVEFALDQ